VLLPGYSICHNDLLHSHASVVVFVPVNSLKVVKWIT